MNDRLLEVWFMSFSVAVALLLSAVVVGIFRIAATLQGAFMGG